MEVSGSDKSFQEVQREKSTLFLSFPEPASEEVMHDAGERSSVLAGDENGTRRKSVLLCRCSCFAELSGGLGRDSGRQAVRLISGVGAHVVDAE